MKTGSFKEKDNRASEETEPMKLQKENQRFAMENDILKQAGLCNQINVIKLIMRFKPPCYWKLCSAINTI
jgi:hypothetical protein